MILLWRSWLLIVTVRENLSGAEAEEDAYFQIR